MIMLGTLELSQRKQLETLLAAALEAADISGTYGPYLPEIPAGRTIVIGAGKGAAAMARELDTIWIGSLEGAVVTRHGYGLSSYAGRIDVIEAGHPVPDESSVAAARKMAELVTGLSEDDLVIALISGGASALLVGLPDGVTLEDKQALTKTLLASGASISEMNTVRKHVSTVKGGRLAHRVGPARLVTFAVSDIPGDDIGAIGSGPTIPDSSTAGQARAILEKYAIAIPPAIDRHLQGDSLGQTDEDALGMRSAHLVVKPADSLSAAAEAARASGYEPISLGDDLEGEARELGAEHARLALQLQSEGRRACLLSGGETTVTLKGQGRGGRNSEYLLGLALELNGRPGISALAADTDGVDGSEDNAGAFVFASTLLRAEKLGINAANRLKDNDSYSFFSVLGDLLITGPTYTNVNDFRAILIDPATEQKP